MIWSLLSFWPHLLLLLPLALHSGHSGLLAGLYTCQTLVLPRGLCNGCSLGLEHTSPDTLTANFLAFLKSMFKHHLLYRLAPNIIFERVTHPHSGTFQSLLPCSVLFIGIFCLLSHCTYFLLFMIIYHLLTPTRIWTPGGQGFTDVYPKGVEQCLTHSRLNKCCWMNGFAKLQTHFYFIERFSFWSIQVYKHNCGITDPFWYCRLVGEKGICPVAFVGGEEQLWPESLI